jgi:hypothetical protein
MMMGKGSGRRPLLISEQEAEDNWSRIFKKDYEYQCNKSTGEVEKRFLDGTSKPNEEQFNGNVTYASSPSENEEGKLPTSTDSGNV